MNEKKKWILPVILIAVSVACLFIFSGPIRDLVSGGLGLFGIGIAGRNVMGRTSQLDDDISEELNRSSESVDNLQELTRDTDKSITGILESAKDATDSARERIQNRRNNKNDH